MYARSVITNRVVQIGDKFLFPGNAEVALTEMTFHELTFEGGDRFHTAIPPSTFNLKVFEGEFDPTKSMTGDDWIHAANNARERGGHFMGALATAFIHADGTNAKPLKEHYAWHFFSFLPADRQHELRRGGA